MVVDSCVYAGYGLFTNKCPWKRSYKKMLNMLHVVVFFAPGYHIKPGMHAQLDSGINMGRFSSGHTSTCWCVLFVDLTGGLISYRRSCIKYQAFHVVNIISILVLRM